MASQHGKVILRVGQMWHYMELMAGHLVRASLSIVIGSTHDQESTYNVMSISHDTQLARGP